MRYGLAAVLLELLLVLVLGACRPRVPAAARDCAADDSTAAIAVALDDVRGRPVRDAIVDAGWLAWAASDSSGVACLRVVLTDTVRLRVGRLGFRPDSALVRLRAGRVARRAVTLHRVERPCCRLEGPWRVQLQLDRLNLVQPEPRSRTISGLAVFSDRLPDWTDTRVARVDSLVRAEYGYSALDLGPFFGGPYARDVSTSVFGGGETLYREMTGIVVAGDSVEMTLIPRMSHGGLSFTGRIAGDTIRGRWTQNAFAYGADGRFTMHRVAGDSATAAIVAGALAAHARDRRVADSVERERAAEQRAEEARRLAEGVQRPRDAWISIGGNDGPMPGDRLLVGQRTRLVADVVQPGGPDGMARGVAGVALAWRSTDSRVLGVDSLGRVDARAPGRAWAVARVRALAPAARFAEGIADSMPVAVHADEGGLGRIRSAVVSAAPTGDATCVVTTHGRVHCLGRVPGDPRQGDDPADTSAPADPMVLAQVEGFGAGRVRALAAGAGFACALREGGGAWCWGDNGQG